MFQNHISKLIILYGILLFVMFTQILSGQSPYYQRITERDGLFSMNVYQITEDENGLIWLATENGIGYFDGDEFKKIIHPRMEDEDFFGLYKAPNGRIWFWNLSGQVFFLKNNKLVCFSDEFNTIFDDFVIRHVIEDNKGSIWFLEQTAKRGFIYSDSLGRCQRLEKSHLYSSKSLKEALEVHRKSPHIPSFAIYDLNKTFEMIRNENKQHTYGNLFYIKSLGWMYNTQDALRQIEIRGNNITVLKKYVIPNERPVQDIFIDQDRYTWVLSDAYVYKFDKDGQIMPLGIPVIEEKSINSVFQDVRGGLWFTIKGEGIIYIPNQKLITYNKDNSPLTSNYALKILKRDNRIIVCNRTGDIFEFEGVNFKTTISFPYDLQLIYERRNRLGYYVDTKAAGLLRLNDAFEEQERFKYTNTKSFIEVDDTLYYGKAVSIFTMIKDMNGQFHFSQDTTHPFLNGILLDGKYKVPPSYSFFNDEEDFYIGNLSGLYSRRSHVNFAKVNFSDNIQYNNSLVDDIQKDQKGVLWLATNNGVFGLKNDVLYQHYSNETGLSSNNCKKINIDSSGLLWVSTFRGVNVINPKTKEVIIIDLSNGLPSNRITDITFAGETVWVGTPSGIAHFQRTTLIKNKEIPPVIVTNVQVGGQDTLIKTMYELTYNDNDIIIDFVSPSFGTQEQLTYEYRLKGWKNEWTQTNTKSIPFTNLPAGKYQFEIYATNLQGNKSIINDDLNITILKPYWQKWWFYVLTSLGGISIFSGIIYLLLTNYRKRREKALNFQRELSESKMQALQSQMNPHFIFNALNAIQHFFTTDARELAILHLNKFARLIRLIFEYSKETQINLHQEINFLKLYLELEGLRFGDKISIHLEVDEIIDQYEVFVPPLMIQPIIENAFKHGLLHQETMGNLWVKFEKKKEDLILCTIEDDGIGREAAQQFKKWNMKEHRSSGVSNASERVELYNQEFGADALSFEIIDLKDNKGNALGTKVVFKIKVMEEE